MKKRIFLIFYIVVMMGISVTLSVFMFFQDNQSSYEEHIDIPSLVQDGKLNENISQDVENYVSKSFGLRQPMLSIYTTLQSQLFQTSPISQVIVGNDGYLYFGETVDDYLNNDPLSSREQYQIIRTLELIQEYVEKQDAEFLFVAAPNKNSLYDHMPSRYFKSNQFTSSQLILSQLDQVNHVDLFSMFQSQKEELYYKTDTHWNNEGARLVYHEMMTTLDKEHDDFSSYSTSSTSQMKGDLFNMLYPQSGANEAVITYDKQRAYQYLTNTRNHEQPYIETYNENAQGSLLMFRDSFANNLIDYLSDAYQYAIYDKNIPYQFDLMDLYQTDTVVLEIAERNIDLIAKNKPLFLAPQRTLDKDMSEGKIVSSFHMTNGENYVECEGVIDSSLLDDNSLIYAIVDGEAYEMTPQMINEQYGFYGCLPLFDYSEVDICITKDNAYVYEKIK